MKTGKAFMFLMVLILSFGVLLAACSSKSDDTAGANANQEEQPTPAATADADNTPAADEGHGVKPVEFSFYANYDWMTLKDWGGQPQSKWALDNLKVNITPIQSNGTAAQKLNTMIVSKELPDVIMLDRGKDVKRLQEAGQLVALDPYLEKYPEYVELVGEQTLNMLRSDDGKLYQLPNWFINGDHGNGNSAYLVEKKIYTELGSPKLETPEDLKAYLELVKQKYPDVIPFDSGESREGGSQMLSMIYTAFGPDRTSGFVNDLSYPDGDQLKSVYQDPAFQEAALYLSDLYREGLVSKDMFTQTRDQIMEKLKNGRIAVYAAYDSVVEGEGREANNTLKAKDPEDGYFAIWPFHKADVDKNKVYPGGFSRLGWNVNVITTHAKDPEAIFTYYKWLSSPEGQAIFFFGPQGLFWDEKDEAGVPIPNDKYINRDQAEYDKLYIGEWDYAGNSTWVDSSKAKRDSLLPAEAQDWTTTQQATVSFPTSKDMTAFNDYDPSPSSEEGIILQRVKDLGKQAIPQMIFAKSADEVKKIIEQTDNDTTKLGFDKVLQYRQTKWQDNLKRMAE